MCLPIFAGVFFRPEEYSLVSIVVNDVCTAECIPSDIRLEHERSSVPREDTPAQFFIDFKTQRF